MKLIRVTGEFYGVHHWPQAPEEVEHLRNLHAHTFKVSAELYVDHGNRHVEFFIAKRNLNAAGQVMSGILQENPTTSCEDMAEQIARILHDTWGYKIWEVVVSEPEIGDGIFRNILSPQIDLSKVKSKLDASYTDGFLSDRGPR